MRRFAATILLAGCASAEPQPDPPEPEPATLSESASSALKECGAKIDSLEQIHPEERARYAVSACRGVWLEPACSESFDSALELASYQRAGHVLRACRDAYCPTLEGEFALCQATLDGDISFLNPLDDPAQTEPLEAWAELNAAIFQRDFGADTRRQYFSSFPTTLLQIVVLAE